MVSVIVEMAPDGVWTVETVTGSPDVLIQLDLVIYSH
jgi:hypothetical protein